MVLIITKADIATRTTSSNKFLNVRPDGEFPR